ncbi:hypothetical protein V2J09_020845 [Rumex salicifolius]
MEVGGPPKEKPAKFAVYQNSAFSAALTTTSLRPTTSTILLVFSLTSASAFALLAFTSRAISLWRTRVDSVLSTSSSQGNKEEPRLTNRQLGLLGVQKKAEMSTPEPSKMATKSKLYKSVSDPLVPLHPMFSPNRAPRIVSDKQSTSAQRTRSFSKLSNSPISPSYILPSTSSPLLPSVQTSPGLDKMVSTPWSNKRASPAREIVSEEDLEVFLADIDKKITESAEKQRTPVTTRNGFGITTPSTISNSANTSGTTRSTPMRPVRMSPSSQKFNTPPKKGEVEFPSPMSMEASTEAFQRLGIYPEIEQWCDCLRQWFSSYLLGPLLRKIETSHIQVMEAAAKLGVSLTVTPVGSDSPSAATMGIASPDNKGWKPALALDEDGVLHQLRANLVQVIDSSKQRSPFANFQQSPQQNALLPAVQECMDSITEHQRLQALMKGELIKGLLPQSSIPAEYTVRRIRALAEGTCLKNYEFMQGGEAYDKVNKKWTLDLPTDSHLLLYLFCAFLEYPTWLLHVEPSSYSGAQSSKNPLFLGVLPPKERFPEKYTAVVSSVPSTLHPGACVLLIGKQSPPIFALYWDKKLQFCLQGRTALWDSILLLCHRINTGYSGFIRGIHLGSSSFNILSVLESEDEDC